MKASLSTRHSTWNTFSQFFSYLGIVLLFSFTLVVGDPFRSNSKPATTIHDGKTTDDPCYVSSKTAMPVTHGKSILYQDIVGHPMELFCTLLPYITNAIITSDNLEFRRNDQVVDKKYVTKVNETTIRLKLENKKESEDKYYCYLKAPKGTKITTANFSDRRTVINWSEKNENIKTFDSTQNEEFERQTVCVALVNIRDYPKVENVSCSVYNSQVLNCTWDVPVSEIQTNYTIKYIPVMPENDRMEAFGCPNDDDVRKNTCKWTLSTKPPYLKHFETLKIIITSINAFNKNNQTFDVQVKGPKNLKLASKTSTSIELEWSIKDSQSFPNPWIYKVSYMTTHIGSNWTSIILDSNISSNGRIVSYNVTNLTPNTLYDFRVLAKSKIVLDEYWLTSVAANIFRTKKL